VGLSMLFHSVNYSYIIFPRRTNVRLNGFVLQRMRLHARIASHVRLRDVSGTRRST